MCVDVCPDPRSWSCTSSVSATTWKSTRLKHLSSCPSFQVLKHHNLLPFLNSHFQRLAITIKTFARVFLAFSLPMTLWFLICLDNVLLFGINHLLFHPCSKPIEVSILLELLPRCPIQSSCLPQPLSSNSYHCVFFLLYQSKALHGPLSPQMAGQAPPDLTQSILPSSPLTSLSRHMWVFYLPQSTCLFLITTLSQVLHCLFGCEDD